MGEGDRAYLLDVLAPSLSIFAFKSLHNRSTVILSNRDLYLERGNHLLFHQNLRPERRRYNRVIKHAIRRAVRFRHWRALGPLAVFINLAYHAGGDLGQLF